MNIENIHFAKTRKLQKQINFVGFNEMQEEKKDVILSTTTKKTSGMNRFLLATESIFMCPSNIFGGDKFSSTKNINYEREEKNEVM